MMKADHTGAERRDRDADLADGAVRPAEHRLPEPALRGLLPDAGDPRRVRTRLIDRVAHANDASHYLLTPQAVVVARDGAHVGDLMRACATAGLPLTFRSGGTSLSGQALSDGVLVDTRQGFRGSRVLDAGRRVWVQPGATVRSVNNQLARYGRKLGPDPASESACTLGGVIANNSSGMSCGTEANTYRTLASMVAVLPSGTVVDTADPDADEALRAREPELHDGLLRLRDRVRADADSVRRIRAQFAMKNTMGYGLNAFLDHDRPAELLARLVVGSEGTLAFVAEAVFDTLPVRPHAATALVLFDSLTAATNALPALVDSGAAALELLDAASLRVAATHPAAAAVLRGPAAGQQAALLVEYQELEAEALADRAAAVGPLLAGLPGALADSARLSSDSAVRADLWHIRKDLYAAVAGARPLGTTALLEDVVVPVPQLSGTCLELSRLFDEHGYGASVIFGHAKDGNIHFMLTEQFEQDGAHERYARFTDDLADLVLGRGGSLKAEHGTGRIMAGHVRRQYGDELFDVMREIKRLFDPRGVLNPGVVLSEDPQAYLKDLKKVPPADPEVDRCVECGYCEPVCPSRDLTLTPRQRIVVRRAEAAARAAGDGARADRLASDYTYEGVETCAADGMCATACPVLIDTGDLARRLRAESRGAAAQRIGRAAADHWSGVTHGMALAMDAAATLPAAAHIATRLARRAAGTETIPEYRAGLPRGGRRRAKAAQSGAAWQGRTGTAAGGRADHGRPVDGWADGGGATGRSAGERDLPGGALPQASAVFFPTCTAAMFGPENAGHRSSPEGEGEGEGSTAALLSLSDKAGLRLAVPPGVDALCCGTPWSSKGLTAGRDRMHALVRRSLRDAGVPAGVPVVCDASSCTDSLRKVLADDGLEVIDAVTFVRRHVLPRLTVHRRWPSLALHPTCSSAHLGLEDDLRAIAAAIADDVLLPDAWGCCAFAGDRGLLHPELTASATAAEAAEVRAARPEALASCNRTCELGMTRAVGQPYVHILELLDLAATPGGPLPAAVWG
jgi:D-lactate dehydrogenase